MKPFDDLTHEELIALTDEQVNYYIDRECAEAGVPLLPPSPPVQPEIEQFPKDITHYIVAGLRFLDEREARSVLDAIRNTKTRRTTTYIGSRWSYSGPIHDAVDESEQAITIEHVHTPEMAAKQKLANETKADLKATFDAAKKTYEEASSGRETVADRVRRAVSAAWKLESRRQVLLSEYDRYKPLANGDETIAKRFLQRAHGDARQVLPALFPDGWNDEPAKPEEVEPAGIPF